MTCDFQQCGILTSLDSDKPVQPLFKPRNSKWCSDSSLTLIGYSSDKQRLWPDCAYAQADLRICWSHIQHCWKSHVAAQISIKEIVFWGSSLRPDFQPDTYSTHLPYQTIETYLFNLFPTIHNNCHLLMLFGGLNNMDQDQGAVWSGFIVFAFMEKLVWRAYE